MDVSGGLSVVQTVLQLLGSPIWSEIESVLGAEAQLDKLKDTVSTIEAVLLDAHDQEQLHPHRRRSHVETNRLVRLREALYRAEDLFDEVTTLAHRKQLMSGYKWCKEVRPFFSCSNQLRSALFSSREIEEIREMLDDVVKDHRHNLGLSYHVSLEENRLRFNPRETYSFLSEQEVIIGREKDKSDVINMLLDSSVGEDDVSVVSIVGIGGLGKTTLAQSVYNDKEIAENFPLKMWVCISEDFDIKITLHKILESARVIFKTSDTLDKLQEELRKAIDGKKYILVLDDVWNEYPEKWHKLKCLLMGGGRGSRIVVTTRSKAVADTVGSCWTHELKGLSDEDSWNLFERMTGKQLRESHLVDVAKAIVDKCARVPLAIRVVGSLLRGQGESTWRHFQTKDLASMKQGENGIVPVLKISYHYLPFHLKSCFLYCAIFPKDHKIMKKELIGLWMAQGLIMLSDGENFEDVGEEYFKQLLQKCFFQDLVRADDSDEILSCKMHDLIHDLAKEVAGTEILSSNYSRSCFNEKTRHIFLDESVNTEDIYRYLTKSKRVRTIFSMGEVGFQSRSLHVLISKTSFVRVLKLQSLKWKTLPNVIGKCLHLRYLDLSGSEKLIRLPCSITKLYNLQTLKLRYCRKLQALSDLSKLVNLRHLDIQGCFELTHMPPGMDRLTSLRSLTGLVVGREGNNAWNCWPPRVGKLGDMRTFTNQSDTLDIFVKQDVWYDEAIKGVHLSEHLREIRYIWKCDSKNNNAETLLQKLQPHVNLRMLELTYYPGVEFPNSGYSSMNLNTCLPNLVDIYLGECKGLEHLPMLSQLRHLKFLHLGDLRKLKYVESRGPSGDELVFFPSLEKLELELLPELKGWWKTCSETSDVNDTQDNNKQQLRHQSSEVDSERCPKPSSFPKLEELKLGNVGEKLKFLSSLPMEAFQHLPRLHLLRDTRIERLSTIDVLQRKLWRSLRTLSFSQCNKLKSIAGRGVWEHFTALETLQLDFLPELKLEENEDISSSGNTEQEEKNEMPWRWLAHSLRVLELSYLPAVVKLPKGMKHLTALHSLHIQYCHNLEEIPAWIGSLSSLQQLHIVDCPKVKSLPEEMCHLTCLTRLDIQKCSEELYERCKKQTGADCHNIQHIQTTHVSLDWR